MNEPRADMGRLSTLSFAIALDETITHVVERRMPDATAVALAAARGSLTALSRVAKLGSMWRVCPCPLTQRFEIFVRLVEVPL